MSNDDLEISLGAHIRDLRIRRRLTQAELAERANVSVGALKHLESGAGARVATLVRVLRALGEEGWIDALGPRPNVFNPLELLDTRTQARRKAARARRVRHSRKPPAS